MTFVCIAALDEALRLTHCLDPKIAAGASSLADRRRKTYLAGRALLQIFLQQLGLCQGALPELEQGPAGKPYFKDHPSLGFNITHSGDLLALSIGDGPQGIDLERVRQRKNQSGLERRLLSVTELAWLDALGGEHRQSGFILLWTLRECLLKLNGRGLAGLGQVAVMPDEGRLVCPGCPAGEVHCIASRALLPDLESAWLSVYSDKGGMGLFTLSDGALHPAAPVERRRFTLEPAL